MKRILVVLLLTLSFALGATAQRQKFPPPNWGFPRQPDFTMEQMVAAREKLIRRYVTSDPRLAWGVSVCGDDDVLTGEPNSWLTIYVYSDSLNAFALDYDKFATHTAQHTLQVDGVTVVVEVLNRKPKGASNGTLKRNDRQPEHKNSRSNAVVSGRPSRA